MYDSLIKRREISRISTEKKNTQVNLSILLTKILLLKKLKKSRKIVFFN